jgi:hypothetical protein
VASPSEVAELMTDTPEEEEKFISDAKKLTRDIVSSSGPMYDVAHLLSVWAVFVPSVHVSFRFRFSLVRIRITADDSLG